MKKRTRIWLAGGLALLSGALAYFYLAGFQPSQTVVVLSRDVPARTVLTPDLVRVEYVDRSSLSVLAADALTSVDDLQNLIALRPLRRGEVLRRDSGMVVRQDEMATLQDAAAEVPLSHLVPPGMRAVTLPLRVPAIYKVGDRVDLFQTEVNRDFVRSTLLLAGVEVFLTGDEEARGDALTVLVQEGDDVRALVAALRTGGVDVVLAPLAPAS